MNRFCQSITALLLLVSLTDGRSDLLEDRDDGSPQITLGASIEALYWAADSPSPSLVKFTGDDFFSPRLSVSVDSLLSSQWYFHATGRIDRGFDVADRPDGQARLDEIFLRYRPFGDGRLNLQAGKSPTIFGSWVGQHDFYDDAFLLAPLPYSQLIGVGVQNPASLSPESISARAAGTAPGIFETRKRAWGSTIWGPAYSSGLSAFGSLEKFDYAFEIKNVSLGSHPVEWDLQEGDFDSPTFSTRIGYRPDAAWAFGLSASRGPYLDPSAERLLPNGFDRGDLPHTLVGIDARWAHRDFIFSGELMASEFETLRAGDLRSLSWYLQARWKAAPGVWVASRFGQTLNNDVQGIDGRSIDWSPDLWRAEVSMGWRITPDLLFKGQFAYNHTNSRLEGPGERLVGLGFGWRY